MGYHGQSSQWPSELGIHDVSPFYEWGLGQGGRKSFVQAYHTDTGIVPGPARAPLAGGGARCPPSG